MIANYKNDYIYFSKNLKNYYETDLIIFCPFCEKAQWISPIFALKVSKWVRLVL